LQTERKSQSSRPVDGEFTSESKKRILLALSVDELYDLSCTLSIPPELLQSLCRFAREFSFPEDAKRALIMPSKYSLCKAILLHA